MSGSDTDGERPATAAESAPAEGSDATAGEGTDAPDEQLQERLAFQRPPIEPEDPAAENALFVVLGALGTVGLLASAVVPGAL